MVPLQFWTRRLETKSEGLILAMSINPPTPIDENKNWPALVLNQYKETRAKEGALQSKKHFGELKSSPNANSNIAHRD